MKKSCKESEVYVELEQLKLDFDIITEKKYTEETGLEIPKIKEVKEKKDTKGIKQSKKVEEKETKTVENPEETVTSEDKSSEVINITPELKEDNKTVKDKNIAEKTNIRKGIDTAPLNTKNEFLNAVSESIKITKEREKKELEGKDINYPYKAVKLMTDAEKQLFLFMENNLVLRDRIRIIPKVRLADIINVDERLCNNKEALWKITSKHVDYIIVDKYTFDLICAVELDDYTHDTDRVKDRDSLVFYSLLSAGVSLYRIKCRIADISKADLRGMEESILMYYRKPCAVCGADTRVRSKSSGFGIGHRFYSCTNFPKCRCTVDID